MVRLGGMIEDFFFFFYYSTFLSRYIVDYPNSSLRCLETIKQCILRPSSNYWPPFVTTMLVKFYIRIFFFKFLGICTFLVLACFALI